MKDVICPRCNSENIVKNGNTIYGKPEFMCKDCRKQFVKNPVDRKNPDEKKELADKLLRSAEAAGNSAVLIEATIRKVNTGEETVDRSEQVFAQVSANMKTFRELADEISQASTHQADGIGEINKAVTRMERNVQKNAASVEDSAAAARSLNTQAENLRSIVDDLVDIIGGNINRRNMRIVSSDENNEMED